MSKLSLGATKLNLSEKARTLFNSTSFKKLMMLCCLLALLLVSALVIFSTQSSVALSSDQKQSQDELKSSSSATASNNVEGIESEREKGRALMLTLEELASDELAKVLNAYFESNHLPQGSVHYDLLDVRDYASSKLLHWLEGDGTSEFVQSSDFPMETHIKLSFPDDEHLNKLNMKDVQSLFEQICQLGIVEIGQRASLSLIGPESERMFICPSADWSHSKIEEYKANKAN
jgi:hypothetical protein